MILNGFAAGAVTQAAQRIRSGELVGLPTETVYGLAADADNDVAIGKIFSAKGRPADHPLIVHVQDAASVAHFAASVPDFAQRLMQLFWPGPLTLILPRRQGVANAAAGGQDSIGLRSPSHPVAQALLKECGASLRNPVQQKKIVFGIAAPSANQFGRVSPTTAAHVQSEFGPQLMILDGGPCAVGIESTIIDCTRGAPVLLRPGAISLAQVQTVCGRQVLQNDKFPASAIGAPRASGTLESHYAPNAKVRLMDASELARELLLIDIANFRLGIYARHVFDTGSTQTLYKHMPEIAETAAQQLFAALREFDSQCVSQIWVERVPAGPEWDGVRDRLQRAATA